MEDFSGVKAALILNGKLLVFLRDDKPILRFANMWDFPGGGREGDETPFQCLQREMQEEFSIMLSEDQIVWQKEYPAMHDPAQIAYFCAARLSQENVNNIIFGSEGQEWRLMDIDEFLQRDDVVPALKGRLRDYLDNT